VREAGVSREPTGAVRTCEHPAPSRPNTQLPATCTISATTIVADKGYAGRELAEQAAELGITIVRPRRQNEPKTRYQLRLSTIRQRIESVFWTLKDLLGLERHGARTGTCPWPRTGGKASASVGIPGRCR
jgi:Transposase DDE domain